jgi:hypothetical protein
MIDFLKTFFAGEKSADEKTLAEAAQAPVQRDVLVVDAYAMDDEEEEADYGSCGSPCGGCGCRS